MRQQILHLVGQYAPPLEEDVLRVGRGEGHRDQLHLRLFGRDAYLCMYCSQRFASRELSRDHIRPFSQGGADLWTNVVAACRRCNNQKASRTPEQAKMQLIAVPFTPTYAEYIFLKGRRVLADQMQYLLAHFPRSSPLHDRIQRWLA